MKLPVVAIIGQTNAGKSSLFNRLVRKSQAIVAREAGTTRDNVVGKVEGQYILIDTAGLKDAEDDFEAHIQDQIDDAVNSADMILIAMDATKYPNHDDKLIAKKALKSGKPTTLLLNKSDMGEALPIEEFYSLGVKNTLRVSATTGLNLNELRDKIDHELKTLGFSLNKETSTSDVLKIALIGRPNVGKSSLFNSLAKKQQAIVANLSGTTRDINRTEIKYKGQTIELLDTAGLRKPGKREVGIEKFSALRSLAAIEEADICCLLVDSTEPHSKLDQTLAGEIAKAGKGIILVLTKTDLEHKETNAILDDLVKRHKIQEEILVFVTVGIANPEALPKDVGLPKNAILGREYVRGNQLEPGDREDGGAKVLTLDMTPLDQRGKNRKDKEPGDIKKGEVRITPAEPLVTTLAEESLRQKEPASAEEPQQPAEVPQPIAEPPAAESASAEKPADGDNQ